MKQGTIGFDDKYKFGLEIEFANEEQDLNQIYSELVSEKLPVKFLNNHALHIPKLLDYKSWYLDIDASVTINSKERLFGGELSSKIMTDSQEDWKEVENICKVLKETKSYPGSYCSEHITVDIKEQLQDKIFIETLYKIITLFETDISLFYMGDNYEERKTAKKYASKMSINLLKNIRTIDFNKDSIENIINKSNSFKTKNGINLAKKNQGLIEIRYPNATLNIETILNNVKFTLSLIEAISENKFDIKYLDYLIDKLETDGTFLLRYFYNFEDEELFNYLINTISKTKTEKKDFIKQYTKVIQTKK